MPNCDLPSSNRILPLEAKSVSKQYSGGLWANRRISLTIGPSEILGLLGPNGSGKTTFVRQITTETTSTSGEIQVFGINVAAHPTKAKSMMGVVPQDWFALWDCSVYHTLRIFGKLRGLSAKAAAKGPVGLSMNWECTALRTEYLLQSRAGRDNELCWLWHGWPSPSSSYLMSQPPAWIR